MTGVQTCALPICGLFAVAFVLLAYATFRAYAAAYGAPGELVEVQSDRVVGLAARLDAARHDAAGRVQRAIRDAVFATFVAVGLIAVAVAVSWFPPSPGPSGHLCVSANGVVIVEVAADHLDLAGLGPGATIGSCR